MMKVAVIRIKVRTHENESFLLYIAQKKGLVNTGPFYKTIKLC
jgi:hypothetical protein